MGGIFISHSSQDNEFASSLKMKLEEQGYSGIFLDFDPMVGIPAGRNWEVEIYNNLKNSSAVIFLCSKNSNASRWCFAEIAQAKALKKEILPIKISECIIDGLLIHVQVIDMVSMEKSAAYQRLWQALRDKELDPNGLSYWKGDRSPYPGLRAFDHEDAAVFFGRDSEIQAGLEELRGFRDYGGSCFLVLLGPSGCGKSSLMRAGLLSRLRRQKHPLRRDEHLWVVVVPFRPLDNPWEELLKAFAATFQVYKQTRDLSELEAEGPQSDTLIQMVNELKEAAGQRDARVLLPIDQMEELLNPALGDKASLFMQVLQDALRAKESQLMVIGTLRSDFLGDFQRHQTFKNLEYKDLRINLMEDKQILQVIVKPAEKTRLELEPELVQKIIKDMASPEALPLMAYTLSQLWEEYGKDGKLTLAEYEQLGGLEGSIGRAATNVLDKYILLSKDSRRNQVEESLRLAFLKMVRLDKAGKSLRKRVAWNDMPSEVHLVLQSFVGNRLLTSGENKSLEVTHEALFENWGLLREWIAAKRCALLEQSKIEASAEQWEETGRQKDYLLQSRALKNAERYVKEQTEVLPLSSMATEFVERSRKERQNGRFRFFGLFLIPLIVLTVWGGNVLQRQIEISRLLPLINNQNFKKGSNAGRTALQKLVGLKYNLENLTLSEADLNHLYLNGALFYKIVLSSANLSGANLSDALISNSNLSGADLSGAFLMRSKLFSTDLSSANLSGADLSGAFLAGSDFRDADLSGADLSETDLRKVSNLTPKQIKSACNWETVQYTDGNITTDDLVRLRQDPNATRAKVKQENQEIIDRIKKDRDSDPKKLPVCSKWEYPFR